MDKENWKRELFSLYNQNGLEEGSYPLGYVKSTQKTPKDGFLYSPKDPLRESVHSKQAKENSYGNSKY